MRGLTVRQPWAWAIIYGGKDVENRSRSLGPYRGPVAIHAGLAPFEQHNMASRALRSAHGSEVSAEILFGAIIGVVDLVDVHLDGDCWDRDMRRLARLYREHPDEFAALPDDGAGGLIGKVRFCSPWAMDGHHHLVLANPRPLAVSIPYRGRLGLWTLPDEVPA